MSIARRTNSVLDVRMAYREGGQGESIVFVHGNPTSSYLWRNVLPHLEHLGRCLAPDLVGMGDSDKLADSGPDSYRFIDHRRYLDAWFDEVDAGSRVVLVGHDWGGVLAMDWARRHPDRVRGIAYLETLVAPVRSDGPNAPDPAFFGPLRSSAGEELVLTQNLFVTEILPAGTQRRLSQEELDAYGRPYRESGEARRPTLTWAREIPIDGNPADVHTVVEHNAHFMAHTPIPKLFINGDPGALLTAELREQCRRWPNQREVTVDGIHFLPEDSPEAIAAGLQDWIPTLS